MSENRSDCSEQNGTTCSPLISFDYVQRWKNGQAKIHWTPNTLVVATQLAINDVKNSYQLQCQLSPTQVRQIQEQLTQIEIVPFENATEDYMLTFSQLDEGSTTRHWTTKRETSQLAALRNQLEDMTHLAYVKSITYWRCGRFWRREKKAFALALKILRLGVETLGYRYVVREDVLDDTYIGVCLAIQEEKDGRPNAASYCIEHTLWTRLHIYAKDFGVQIPNDLEQALYPVFDPNKDY